MTAKVAKVFEKEVTGSKDENRCRRSSLTERTQGQKRQDLIEQRKTSAALTSPVGQLSSHPCRC
jgi:hypothetical protein